MAHIRGPEPAERGRIVGNMLAKSPQCPAETADWLNAIAKETD